MYKIKFIAPKHLIGPLAILGIETFPAESESDARRALDGAAKKREPALIFITERLAVDLQPEIKKLNRKPDINIVMIPDNRGSTGLASSQIDDLVKNSIGAEVIIRK
jgi:V/A-type H+-transporting ATPase subunit F